LVSASTTERVPLVSARPMRQFSLSDRHYKWILLLPAILVVVGLTLFPLVFSLAITFTNWDLYSADSASFAGLSQWARLFSDRGFLTPARNTVVFTAGVVPVEFVMGLIVALALNNATVGRTFFRVFFLVPLMVSPVATSFIMGRTMFDPNVGPIHDLLVRFGLPSVPWLTHPTWAMVTLMLIDSWGGTAFMILLFTAGLQGMPQEPYEAAKVDGASDWQLLWHITLPLLAPVMVAAVLIRALDAFKVVDIIATVTGGGPGDATESLTLKVYNLAVKGGDVAYGAAASYGLVVIMIVFATLFLLATRKAVRRATGDE
jgi:multiple sugar transport system permease protein